MQRKKQVNPYLHIELSDISEPEDLINDEGEKNKNKEQKTRIKRVSPRLALIKSCKTALSHLDSKNYDSLYSCLQKLVPEVSKIKFSIPKNFLFLVDRLNHEILKDENKTKNTSKILQAIKKKINEAIEEFGEIINIEKEKGGFNNLDLEDVEEESLGAPAVDHSSSSEEEEHK